MSKAKIYSKIYLPETVFEASLNRMRWLFDEFEKICVAISGGKDSTVILNLALIVAEEKNRLPLNVMFLDQELEWMATINYIRRLREDDRINLDWLQVPVRIFNVSSAEHEWLYAWGPNLEWVREKELNSIHNNIYGTDRFAELLIAYQLKTYGENSVAISGVRTDESPTRYQALTALETYKGATWGAKRGNNAYTMYPIYDWAASDVWKAIHDNNWDYNSHYDHMYSYGIPLSKMRVSNLNHETALDNVFFLQEVEPENWQRITKRLQGMNTVGQLQQNFYKPKTLPPMFQDWREYRDYLLEHLITNTDHRTRMRKQFASADKKFMTIVHEKLWKAQINAILANDYHGTKLAQFYASHLDYRVRNRDSSA